MGKQKTTTDFIKDAQKIHGNKYDYSKVIYKTAQEKVCIICPIHGEFWQTPNSHLNGRGCPKCGVKVAANKNRNNFKGKTKKHKTKKEILEIITKLYKDKYDLSKIEYKDTYTKICLICPKHGEFWKTPINLIYGKQGCPKCAIEERNKTKTKTQENFIKEANLVHFNFYDYSKTKYEKARKNVIITCPIHGDFLQTPDNHLKGCGCPYCQSSILEKIVRHILDENNIEYIQQYKPKWLGKQSLDFYLPYYNVAIECQGRQHIKPDGNFGSKTLTQEEIYNKVCELDDRKNILCKENNINLIYYAETDEKYRYSLCKNKNELLKALNDLVDSK